jgi:predicted ATPase/DNA-binding CsgD family transcriptional regulator
MIAVMGQAPGLADLRAGTLALLLACGEPAAERTVIADAILAGGGMRLDPEPPDGIVGVFGRPSDAVSAALEVRRLLPAADVALHVAQVERAGDDIDADRGVDRCRRLRAIANGGQIVLSRVLHDLVIDNLPDGAAVVDLGEHLLRDLGSPERVWALADVRDGRRGAVTAAPPHNLPAPRASFVGRADELAAVDQALEHSRLVTLTGAGGCGKTRLALQWAARATERFPDGVWWVELAPLRDVARVATAVSEALDVGPLPGVTELQAVCAHLTPRRALIVLDNCEHLLDGVRETLSAVIEAAPDLAVLATSRVPLEIDGEQCWRVPSLSLPPADPAEPAEQLTRSDAVRLFSARASSVRPNFEITSDNAPSVARICRNVDGIPLAIELAAARVRVLPVDQVAERLSASVGATLGGRDGAESRHATLTASVDWSHDLLTADEQTLFRRLAVFTGGFSLDVVESVCADDDLNAYSVLGLLASLVDKSLVGVDERLGRVRYRLLEIVRESALSRLEAAGEAEDLRARHRDAFLALAERAGPALESADQTRWMDILDADAANLSTAIDYAIRTRPDLALRFCRGLTYWWRSRRPYAEVTAWYARVLADCADQPPGLRADALWGLAFNLLAGAEFEKARSRAAEAMRLADLADDDSIAARALCVIGFSHAPTTPAAGRKILLEAAERAGAAGDDWALATAWDFAAFSYLFQDDHSGVQAASAEAADAVARVGDPGFHHRAALVLSSVELLQGRLQQARAILDAAHPDPGYAPDRITETWIIAQYALLDIVSGRADCGLEALQQRFASAAQPRAGTGIPAILTWTTWAQLATGQLEAARASAELTISIVDGRDALLNMWSHWLLGEALRLLGDRDGARKAAETTCAIGEEMGNRLGATRGEMTLARLAAADAEWSRAEHHALAHMDCIAEEGHQLFLPHCLDALAEVAWGLQSHEEATGLLAAADRARGELGVARWTPEAAHWDDITAALRASLEDDAYAAAWEAGAALDVDAAIGWARRARGARKRPPAGWESLTPTEGQVVELVAEGLTNPQVAERMFISRGTVKAHLTHIFQKLDVSSRAELAAYATRRLL